jgi:hypothetical protein
MSPSEDHRAARRRLLAAGALSAAVVAATVVVPSYGTAERASTAGGYEKAYRAATRAAVDSADGTRTIYLPDGTHVHVTGTSVDGTGKVVYDAKVKNALSRTGQTAGDPTSPAQAARNRAAAARQRAQQPPPIRHVPLDRPRTAVPHDRYAMYDGCYALRGSNGRWLAGARPAFTASTRGAATPVYFKATDLGRYLLYSPNRTYLGQTGAAPAWATAPSETANWIVTEPAPDRFSFRLPNGKRLPGQVRLHRTSGCAVFPEIGTNVTGKPIAGTTPYQEVRGFIDAHTHGMAFEFLGGKVHCGRPWHPYGVAYALKDCPDHTLTGGKGAVMEDFLSGDFTGHDPVGWPTFKDWPAPHSLTHEGTYYKWMERSWRAGQRILVNLLVENNQLCKIYPLKRNSCNDMDSIRLQARDMHALERYIDAQHGGPGRGWYRIVTNPEQARRVINAGKLAVVMGIETSVPFGCSQKLGIPTCTTQQLDQQLDAVRKMGVRQMELVNKFDNGLAGVAGDEGTTGNLVNLANFLETGSFWRMQHCAIQDPEIHDKDQNTGVGVPDVPAQVQDALFGAIVKVSLKLPALPLYPRPHHCNALGLTDLGKYVIRGMAKRHMIFDPDHMSVKARKAALDEIDRLRYPGVVSSHSWSTPDAYPRIYQELGFITPYAGDSAGFVAKWKRHLGWANPKTYWGFGFGADINGLGAQGEPRTGATNPVRYPFTTLGGVTVHRQVSGQRVYDINKDGVAHYGLYPDWIEDLRMQAGDAIVQDMARGPEAYLQMWERAEGIRPNACTNGARHSAAYFKHLRKGTSAWTVLRKAGQPDRRLGRTYTYCTTGGKATLTFSQAGALRKVTSK